MKNIETIASTMIMLGAVACSSTAQQGGPKIAAAATPIVSDVGSSSYGGRAAGAESLACASVSDAERTSPLQRTKVIFVEELRDESQKGHPGALRGATVYLLAAPDLTKEWLGHIIECHTTLPPVPTGPDPLTVEDSSVEVSSTRNGFAVHIHSIDGNRAREILNSANALMK